MGDERSDALSVAPQGDRQVAAPDGRDMLSARLDVANARPHVEPSQRELDASRDLRTRGPALGLPKLLPSVRTHKVRQPSNAERHDDTGATQLSPGPRDAPPLHVEPTRLLPHESPPRSVRDPP